MALYEGCIVHSTVCLIYRIFTAAFFCLVCVCHLGQVGQVPVQLPLKGIKDRKQIKQLMDICRTKTGRHLYMS